MESNVSIPIKICTPNSYYLNPALNRFQATTKAGAYSEKVFRIKSLFKRNKSINVTLIERRLAPFWSVRCKSRFHYDKETSYSIHVDDSDAVEITFKTLDDQQMTLPVNRQSKQDDVFVNGWERCITERDITEYIDTYMDVTRSFSLKTRDMQKRDEQARLAGYLSTQRIPINDLSVLYQEHTLDGEDIFPDLREDEAIQVILPDEPANRVVSEVMKKVMVSIEPVRIHDWSLSVEVADLYYRPFYIFLFEHLDNSGETVETRYEQLDGIRGDWKTIPTMEVDQAGKVPWDKIMMLSLDASLVVLQELGGPWVRVATGLSQVGMEHVPGIVDDMKGSADQEPGQTQ